MKVDVRKNKDAARLHEMLCSWQQAAAMLEAGEISKEDYDKWRYHYPEFDKAQTYVKVPPPGPLLTLSLVGHGRGRLLHKIIIKRKRELTD